MRVGVGRVGLEEGVLRFLLVGVMVDWVIGWAGCCTELEF